MSSFVKKLIFAFFAGVFISPALLRGEVLVGAHDPTVIRDSRGVYTLLTTNNLLQIRQSTDEINWKVVGNIVPAVPAWVNTALGATIPDIWAPDARYRNGLYWVYYACSSFGTNNSVIGLATNPTLDPTAANYKWTDQGLVFQSSTSNNYNAIDPASYVDLNGNVWLVFGSFWSGIKMIAVDPATGKQLASNTTVYSLASRGGGAIEGATLIEHDNYYYLFSSWDACCQGVNSTYNVRVGRSASVTGPYLDEAGVNLMNSGGTEVLSAYGIYIGPGGGSALHDGRRDFYSHHYYNANEGGNPYLHNREIVWDSQDWPHLTQPYMGHHNGLEAEHAQLTDVNFAQTASASNGEYINNIDAADSRVAFHFNALASETYELRILYANGGGSPATHLLTVNSNPQMTVTYPPTTAYGAFSTAQTVTMNVPLTEGYNLISFQQGAGQAELDRVDVLRPAGNVVPAGSADNGVSYTYQPAGNAASLSAAGWTEYEYLDFKTGGYNSLLVAFTGSATGPLRFVLDSLTGSVAVTTTLNVSGPQTVTVPLPASYVNTTGVHDVFVQFNGSGSCPLSQFQFSLSGITNTPTGTPTFTPTKTSTPVPPTVTRTNTATVTRTSTASFTSTSTPTKTNSPTNSFTPSFTASRTATASATATPTSTTTASNTASRTSTVTSTNTPVNTSTFTLTATSSFTKTSTPSNTATSTFTNTLVSTSTSTASRTATPSVTSTATPTFPASNTPTASFTKTNTPVNSVTSTSTTTWTSTPSSSSTRTATASATASNTPSWTPTVTSTPTNSSTATASSTGTQPPTLTPTSTGTATPTETSTQTSTHSFTTTNTFTPTQTSTPTSSFNSTATVTSSATNTASSTSTMSFTATMTSTFVNTATQTVTPSSTYTPSFTSTATNNRTSTSTATFTTTFTSTFTFTATPTFTFTPTITVTSTSTAASTVPVLYPNPTDGTQPVTVYIPGITEPTSVTVRIYTTAFRMVRSLSDSVTPGSPTVSFAAADNGGSLLADGFYYVVVTTPKARTVLKLMVLR